MALDLVSHTVGSGPPLLVLHGLFGSSSNWRSVARELAATHTVVSVDLRNHGASPWAEAMDYPAMAEDLRQLIDTLGLVRPAVLGHSMGGKAAMALALLHPALVERLIVVDVAPVSYTDTLTPFAEAMRGADVMAAASRTEVQRRLQQLVPDEKVVPFLMQNLMAQNDHFDWRLNLMGISAAIPTLCGFPEPLRGRRFGGPVTVIAGASSNYVAERDGSAFKPMFTQVEVDVIEGAGHWVHADQPAAFVRRVRHALEPRPSPALHTR